MHKSTSNESLQIELTPIDQKNTSPPYTARLVSSYLSKKLQFRATNYKNTPPNFKNVYLQTKDKNIIGMYVQENQEETYKINETEEQLKNQLEAHVQDNMEGEMQNEGNFTKINDDVKLDDDVKLVDDVKLDDDNKNKIDDNKNKIDDNKNKIDENAKQHFLKANAKSLANKITLSAKNFTNFITKNKKNKTAQKKGENAQRSTFDMYPKKILIYIHGMMQNRQTFVKHLPCELFDMLNYTLIIPDLRSFGECNYIYNKNGFNTDLDRIIEYVNNKYNNPQITLIGHCIGAGIVLNYCKYTQTNAQNINNEPKVVLISPATNEKEVIKKSSILKVYGVLKRLDYEKAMDEMTNDTIKLIKYKEKNNVIIFHGKKDKTNSIEDGIRIANEIGCKIYRSENDDYMSILSNEEVVRKIDEFCNM